MIVAEVFYARDSYDEVMKVIWRRDMDRRGCTLIYALNFSSSGLELTELLS